MKYTRKFKIIFSSCLLSLVLGFCGLSLYLHQKINGYIVGLATKLSDEIGHPVTIAKVTTQWDWLYLKINLNDLVVLDKDTSVPLFMVNSIVGTVDTFYSVLSLRPKFTAILFNSPRLILQLDPNQGPMILGLYGSDKSSRISPKLILQLIAMQRKVSVENGDIHIQGDDGVDIPLMKVKFDFKKKSNLEFNIVARGEIAAAKPPEFNFAMNYHGRLDEYLKAMIDFDFKTSNIQIDQFLDLFPKYNYNHGYIKGVFKSLDIMGAVQNGLFRYINTEFTVDKLNIAKDTEIIGGDGRLEFKPTRDKINLFLSNIQFGNQRVFSKAIKVDAIRGEVSSIFDGAAWGLSTNNLTVKLDGMELLPVIQAKFIDKKVHSVELSSKVRAAHVSKVLKLMPDRNVPPALNSWLSQALVDGYISSTKLKYEKNKLYWDLDFKEIDLKYSQQWPSVSDLSALLVLDDGKLSITASEAKIFGNKINALTAKFEPGNGKPYGLLKIDGNLDAKLESSIDVLKLSPLNGNVLRNIVAFNPSGDMHLGLQLAIKLQSATEVGVKGSLDLKHATALIPNIKLALNDINGHVDFSQDTLSSDNLTLKIFEQLAKGEIAYNVAKAKELKIKLGFPLQLDSLKELIPSMDSKKINGHTNVKAEVLIPCGDSAAGTILSLNSDLVGVNIDYPAPLFKAANSKLPFEFKYIIKDNAEESISIALSQLLRANFALQKNKYFGGHLHFGTDKNLDLKKDTLLISGKLDSFDFDIWQPWLENKSDDFKLPVQIDMFINKLTYHGEKYRSIAFKFDTLINKLTLDSPIITGTIVISKDEDKIDMKLSNLDLGSTKLKNNILLETIKEKNKSKQLPLIQFYCDKLKIDQKEYSKVNVQLLPRTYGYDITDFSISNDNILLQAQGQWQMDSKESTQISGNAYTKNFGKVLADWGYGNSMTKGNGELNFSLGWEGNPTAFDIYKLEGDSHIELHSGNLTGVNPGLGRIIGLLSIESIQRRVKLDFSDLNSKGFSFDKLVSDIKLRPGVISSENIIINSPSSRIELSGKSFLKKQELDFTMYVIPKVSVGLPVAAAIAVGNPAVGAAIWLFDQATGSKIGEISKYKYRVTGTWGAPKIDEILAKKAVDKKEEVKQNDVKKSEVN
jgi:uncharacterized protein (TIGR02099 family)